jgi:pyruvate formate lyase activating enzyme
MAPALHEAWLYERHADGRVHCTVCPHDCRIANGFRGVCPVRYNEHGVHHTLVYDRIASHRKPS